jgi:hypothetical protein
MASGRWSPSIIQGWINEVAAMPKWVALFFADPIGVDPSSVEVLGPSYAGRTRSGSAAARTA